MPPATPRSLIRETDIAALPLSREVLRRDSYWVIRSPSNPEHYWGNLLLFDTPPQPGDGPAWERRFDEEFAGSDVEHRTLAWEGPDGALGAANDELLARGYELEKTVGLRASIDDLRPHPRASADVEVRALDPAGDRPLWAQVIELHVIGGLAGFDPVGQRHYAEVRMHDLRELFTARGGAWFVALDGDTVAGSCGIVLVDDERARYQAVDTIESHRRKGICSRLLVDAAHTISERHGQRTFVIGADPDYHALGLYESLGFSPVERIAGAYQHPPGIRP